MLGELAKCVAALSGVRIDANDAEREARTTRDTHQRLRRVTTGVYGELWAVLEVVPPAVGFSRSEPAPLLQMLEADRQKVIDALPDSPWDIKVIRLYPETAAKPEAPGSHARLPEAAGSCKAVETMSGGAPPSRLGIPSSLRGSPERIPRSQRTHLGVRRQGALPLPKLPSSREVQGIAS